MTETQAAGTRWAGLTAEEVRAAADAREEKWETIGSFRGRVYSHYQVSDKGGTRSADRAVNGRRLRGRALRTRASNSGYELADITSDDGKRSTVTVHSLVLAKFDPRCADGMPDGMQTRHGPAGPLFNAIENLDIGTQPQNEADKPEPSRPPEPSHPCRNAPHCRCLVVNEGRRCPCCCVPAAGRKTAAMLKAGMPLAEVAARLGNSESWAYQIARDHGYSRTKAHARSRKPGPVRRAWLRLRFPDGDSW